MKGHGFNPVLRQRCARISRQLIKMQTNTMVQVHALGKQLKEIRDSSAYGYRAFERALGDLIDLDQATADTYIAFAEEWSQQEIKALLARRTASGHALCLGHFLYLKALHSQQERSLFTEKIFQEDLSARDLGRLITQHLREQKKLSRLAESQTTRESQQSFSASGPSGTSAPHDRKCPRVPNRRVQVPEPEKGESPAPTPTQRLRPQWPPR